MKNKITVDTNSGDKHIYAYNEGKWNEVGENIELVAEKDWYFDDNRTIVAVPPSTGGILKSSTYD